MKKIKLFCFPHAGGAASSFNYWKKYLDLAHIELCPLELPGRGRRFSEKLLHSMQEAVEDIHGLIKNDLDSSPYAFFGHSLGCLLAFELGHKALQSDQRNPLHIFFSGHTPPHIELKACFIPESFNKFINEYKLDEKTLLNAVTCHEREGKKCFAINRIEKIKSSHPEIYNALIRKARLPYDLPEDEFIHEVLEYGGSSQEIFQNEELRQLVLPVLRADAEIYNSYRYTEKPSKLRSAITVLYGKDEEDITTEDIKQWDRHTEKSCEIIPFSGGHFFIEQNLTAILDLINKKLISNI